MKLLIVTLLLVYIYLTWFNRESFENRMQYTGMDFMYNNDPRSPTFNYVNYISDALLVQNPDVYTNKSLYSIDY